VNHRDRVLAILNYQTYDQLPIIHFGYWGETLAKWRDEGHVTAEEATTWGDGNEVDTVVAAKLGFDMNWTCAVSADYSLRPRFESKLIAEFPDGARHVLDGNGMVILQKPDAGSIPAEIDHLLKDRAAWEEHYKWRLDFDPARVGRVKPIPNGLPRGLHCGSLLGEVRNWVGVEGMSYLLADDMELFEEITSLVADLCYRCVEISVTENGPFDFGHFWEDICFKNGPLISPRMFDRLIGPHYKRITDLLHSHGIMFTSLDCDGKIDALIPTWLENGVNVMFPIEVGTWEASIAPWREKYGREILGVGGMDKRVFAANYAAIDAEIERMKPLVALGGYIPCPDHRIAPDAKWENVQYYCDKMRQTFA